MLKWPLRSFGQSDETRVHRHLLHQGVRDDHLSSLCMRGTRIETLRGFGAALMMHPGDGRTSIRSEKYRAVPYEVWY